MIDAVVDKYVKRAGMSAQLGVLETFLEKALGKELDDWKAVVHAKLSGSKIILEIENWFHHDPSVGMRGGREAILTLEYRGHPGEMVMHWKWEPHVEKEEVSEMEKVIAKNKSRLESLAMSIILS